MLALKSTDTGLILLVQRIVMLLSVVQFILLIRNQHTVGGDLLIDIDDLRVKIADFLINHIFSGDNILNFVFIFVLYFFVVIFCYIRIL